MHTIAKVGFYAATVAAIACIGFTAAQLLQNFETLGPPWDGILIYGFSLGIAPAFLLAMLALHYSVPVERRFWSHASVLFALLYTGFAVLVYVVQLAAVMPYGVTNPVLVVAPHSFFWTLDALAYINMGLAALFAVPALAKQGFQRRLRGFFLAHALVTPLVCVVYFYPKFSIALLYLASPWSVTAVGSMVLMAGFFARAMRFSAVLTARETDSREQFPTAPAYG